MKKKKVILVGYFGYISNQIDGQTVRSRSILALFNEMPNVDVVFFDTEILQSSKFKVFNLMKLLFEADIILNISAQRNLKYLFPMIYLFSKLTNSRLNYVSIGGWLHHFIDNMPIHKFMLKNIDGIYVQTENLERTMKDNNFLNVHLLSNFRVTSYPVLKPIVNLDGKIKLVFMARVNPLKGVDILFDLKKQLDLLGFENVSIDIFGPVLSGYKEEFNKKLGLSSVNYCGVLEPEKIYQTLTRYDLMLFPTKYYTEGFPGTILDAYICGLPVVATNWLNAEEFIESGKTGFITAFDDESKFIDAIIKLVREPKIIAALKENVGIKRQNYSSGKALEVLTKTIF